jgi:N-acetylglucosamine-6-phosphate deacetylase
MQKESFEAVYKPEALAPLSSQETKLGPGVRIIIAVPEVTNVLGTISELTERGITTRIGHSSASGPIATAAVKEGVDLITHLFNAILHHRDPGIVGLLGASPSFGKNVPFSSCLKITGPKDVKQKEDEAKQD